MAGNNLTLGLSALALGGTVVDIASGSKLVGAPVLLCSLAVGSLLGLLAVGVLVGIDVLRHSCSLSRETGVPFVHQN